LLAGALAACAQPAAQPPPASPPPASLAPHPLPHTDAAAAHATAAHAYPLATVPKGSLGPFVARAADGALAAWFQSAESTGYDLLGVLLGDDSAPMGPSHPLSHVATLPDLMAVRPSSTSREGWTLAFSTQLDRGEVLTTLGVSSRGVARGEAVELHRTGDSIVWLDVLPLERGALTVWAEEGVSGDATLLVGAMDERGNPRGVPMRIARGVRRWQAVSAGRSAGIALVTAHAADPSSPGGADDVAWQPLDTDGRPLGESVRVATAVSVDSNVEVASLDGGWLFGWTDRSEEDPQVVLGGIDRAGRARKAAPAFSAGGASVLQSLVSNGDTVASVWIEPQRRQDETQLVTVGLVSPDGTSIASRGPTLEASTHSPPALVPDGNGFALLISARVCRAPTHGRACEGPFAPTVVPLNADLKPTSSEPFFVGDPRSPATAGWGLACAPSRRCLALAATSELPTPVFTLDLQPRVSPFEIPLVVPPPPGAPRLVNVKTIASGAAFEDLAAAALGDDTFVAALTTDAEAGHGRRPRANATIATLLAAGSGPSPAEPKLLASRASPIGGVAVAPGDDPSDGALVAWITREGNRGDVMLAQTSDTGHVVRSVQLATADPESSGVAVAWAGDGWLVAWIDARAGSDQVFAAKVGRRLQRPKTIERVTHAAVAPSDLALTAQGDIAWLAWSDARESPREGIADIFATTLRASNGARAGDEIRVLATARHSRSPSIAATTNGRALIAWIEDAPAGVEAHATGLLGCLDATPSTACRVVDLPLAGSGQPVSIQLAGARDEGHAVIARSRLGGGIALDALRLDSQAALLAPPSALLTLDSPPSVEVALAIAGRDVVFTDVAQKAGERRIRRAEVEWRP
jgi:hypothetical protein